MPRSTPEHLIIPVETLNREFDGKLLLAMLAAERGYRPIIGGRTLIHSRLHDLPRSLYLAKDVRPSSRLIFSIIEKLGHVIVALDEEALVRFPDETFLTKLDNDTFNRARLLYAWGRSNAEVWRKFKGYRGTPILETGNPRFDMLRPEMRGYYDPMVAALRARYGRFTLLSSNFGVVNHFIPGHGPDRVTHDVPHELAKRAWDGFQVHKLVLFGHFQTLVPKLAAALAPNRLVIRPHPSENPDVWLETARGLDNVSVIHEGPIAPWLTAASALVHNGCTSAVEASLLGTPAFAFRPVRSNDHDLAFPNSLSTEAATAEDFISRVVAAAEPGGRRVLDNEPVLAAHVDGRDHALACERILDSLKTHCDVIAAASERTWPQRLKGLAHLHGRNAARAVRTRRRTSKSSAEYTRHKFPGIALEEVNRRIKRFAEVTGRFAGIEARELRPSIFAIEWHSDGS